MTEAYWEFLARKKPAATSHGVAADNLPEGMFDFQRHCAEFAIEKGRAGIYLDTGLGKSVIELAFADNAARATGMPALILTPLAVAWQMQREAAKFGLEAKVIRDQSEATGGINICNYDRLDKLDPAAYGAVVLDEASTIKNFTGKTSVALMAAFEGHRFRLAATATPAPNDHMELGQQCQFLGVMPSNEMLMRWFIADQTAMGRYRLKAHGERDFWDWMASWSRMAENPEDMGFDGARFVLPPMEIARHRVQSHVVPDGELFASAVSATNMHGLKRQTSATRASKSAELLVPGEPCVIWCDTNYEADELKRLIPEAIEVRGSMDIEEKEELLRAFADREADWLISKPSICGFGLNWQHCAHMIFVGRTFSFESYYQAVRRCWRFGQTRKVHVDLVMAEGEDQIAHVIDRKATDHKRMRVSMRAAMRRAVRGDEHLQEYNPTFGGRLPAWL